MWEASSWAETWSLWLEKDVVLRVRLWSLVLFFVTLSNTKQKIFFVRYKCLILLFYINHFTVFCKLETKKLPFFLLNSWFRRNLFSFLTFSSFATPLFFNYPFCTFTKILNCHQNSYHIYLMSFLSASRILWKASIFSFKIVLSVLICLVLGLSVSFETFSSCSSK